MFVAIQRNDFFVGEKSASLGVSCAFLLLPDSFRCLAAALSEIGCHEDGSIDGLRELYLNLRVCLHVSTSSRAHV